MNKDEIKHKIETAFSKLHFEEESHTYSVGFKEFIPVSNKIKSFYKEFDSIGISEKYAKKHGLNQNDVLREWSEKGEKAAAYGTKIHTFAEKWVNDGKPYLDLSNEEDTVKKQVIRFWSDLPYHYSVLLTEQKMYTDKHNYAGTTDFILYDERDDSVILGDYKTNKDIFKNYGEMMKKPFQFLEDTPFNHYQIQLSLYQILLEEIGIPVSGRVIVWFKPNEDYKLYFPENFTDLLKTVL
jgi:hypothetical protein